MVRLIIQESGGRKYLYFLYKNHRLYLGTPKKIKIKTAMKALNCLDREIRRCIRDQQKITNLLNPKEDYKISDKPYYRLIVFNVESIILPTVGRLTDISQLSIKMWRELFRKLQLSMLYDKIEDIYKIYNDYIGFTRAASKILKTFGVKKESFENVINEFILIPGTKKLFKELHRHKIVTALVTDTFEALAHRISKELNGVDHILAYCRFDFQDNKLNSWNLNPVGRKQRKEFVEKIAKKHNIPLKQCVYVGNNVKDIDAFESVGLAILLNCMDISRFANVGYISRGLTDILHELYSPLRKSSVRKNKK